jgi:hypothetical protein
VKKGLIRRIYESVEMAKNTVPYLVQAQNIVEKLKGKSSYSVRKTVCVPPRYWDRKFLITNIIDVEKSEKSFTCCLL